MLPTLVLGSCLATATLPGAVAVAQPPRPNILFILADNLDYGDLGVYGGGELRGAPTPRIDELAAQGLRLTQFLVEPGCTPSRAAFMTGRYSIPSGLSLVAVEGSATGSLPATEITMAEMLRDAGYATAMFGKWHLGSAPSAQPQNKGFDEYYGIPPGVAGTRSSQFRKAVRPRRPISRWTTGPRSLRPNGESREASEPTGRELDAVLRFPNSFDFQVSCCTNRPIGMSGSGAKQTR